MPRPPAPASSAARAPVASRAAQATRTGERLHLRYIGQQTVSETAVVRRATDADAAEQAISDLYLPNRLHLEAGGGALDMRLTGLRVGALTAGRLSYGRAVRLTSGVAENFHVNLPLRGSAVSRRRHGEPVETRAGQAAAFEPGDAAEVRWSDDCVHMCLMVPRGALEGELEALLQRPVTEKLRFAFAASLEGALARRWRAALQLLLGELDRPSGLADFPAAGRHLEGLVLDALLLSLPHNHTESLLAPPSGTGGDATSRAVRRAADLLDERPGEAWTTTRLASAVHLGVRTLQEGFGREFELPPMAYLRRLRLRHVRDALVHADPGTTTVRSVATEMGFVHQGRFTAAYRETYGENPSVTLRRDATTSW